MVIWWFCDKSRDNLSNEHDTGWAWHSVTGEKQDPVYSGIISGDDDLKFHPFQNHASVEIEGPHSVLFSSHYQARG